MLPNSRVTIITVCHNSLAVLPDMLKSIPVSTPKILVDNDSADKFALRNLADEHGAALSLNSINIGFGRACNLGAASAETEFLLFLNPDTTLLPGALQELVAASVHYPQASGFNPKILNRNGRQSFRRGSKIRPKERLRGPLPTSDSEVSILSGAALFCRRTLFDKVGGFDPAIFMYHEDDDLSLRLREQGPLMYCHRAEVVHNSGHGSPRLPEVAALKAYYSARSRVYALGKHGHPRPALNTLVAAAFRLINFDTLFSKRRRAKNLGYMKGALSASRDGGRFEHPTI